ncbi:glycosyltransferase [Hassallia byssoidea VB512170]|uniref:Glycosyltransferase n=1 Tax=Hassallia byssoidea VB512170 TaxID=1304833 RepID=A0A846HD82_9CYAN|nr:glycosyltransferase [Hassalia byssoidea]NEU75023.1 glycosyltransferase [Hassalia byssoidea VB512170]
MIEKLRVEPNNKIFSNKTSAIEKKILLVMPVPLVKVKGRLGFDEQTCDGLIRWAENFDRVVMACPLMPEHITEKTQTSTTWKAIADLPCADRLELVPLPYAYKLPDFIQTFKSISQLLTAKIQECEYLCFAICGIIGDWGAIACLEAIKLKRPYSIWADRVEYEVMLRTFNKNNKTSLKRRFQDLFTLLFLKPYQQYLVSRSHLGLFQGQDCYSAYSPFCKNPHCVYDIHTKKSDLIDASSLERKINSLLQGEPLLICYAGRAAEMKGPLDWLRVVHRLVQVGVNIQATWLGDGPLLLEMKSLADKLGIAEQVHFAGFVDDQNKLLETMKKHHIFLFCHKTPESPRCLVESLVCGCPIVGYSSLYPEGLVSEYGGGAFVPMNDWQKLAYLMVQLNLDRAKLSDLISQAALSGQQFDEQVVFTHRSDLIKQYLTLI